VRGGDRDQPLRSDADRIEAGAVGRGALGQREILGDPEHASACRDGAVAACRERQREGGGGDGCGLVRGGDRGQGAAAKPSAQDGVDRGETERKKRARCTEAFCRLRRAERSAQPVDHGGGSKGLSHGSSSAAKYRRWPVFCSCFVLLIPKLGRAVKRNP